MASRGLPVDPVTFVYLSQDPHGGPFWDDEGCVGDDWVLWEALGLTRATYDACMAWNVGPGHESEKSRLLRLLRAELPVQIEVGAARRRSPTSPI